MARAVTTPVVLQMEATECGAASLSIILAYYGKYVLLEEARKECGVSRDGSRAPAILEAARRYEMTTEAFSKEPEDLAKMEMPVIIHWNFNHFLVLEGFGKEGRALLNDPACGRRSVSAKTFSESFTGITLVLRPGDKFEKTGQKDSIPGLIRPRLEGLRSTLLFLLITSLALVIPGLALPTLARVFVDDVLLHGKDDWLRPVLIGMGLTAVARGWLTWLKSKYLLRAYTKLAVGSSAKFFWHLLKLPVGFFQVRFAGDVGNRIQLTDRVATVLTGRLAQAALDVLMIGLYGALLFSYDVVLTLVGVTTAVLNIIALRYLARRRADDSQRVQQEAGKLVGVAMGGLQIIETLKASGTETDFFSKWAGYWAKVQNSTQDLEMSTLYLSLIPTLLTAMNQAAILTLGGFRVMDGAMTVGMLVGFQSLMSSFLQPVGSVMQLGGVIQETATDMKRLDDIQENPVAPIVGRVGPPPAEGEATAKLEGGLRVRNLTFGYVRQSPPLLKDFHLTLSPGDRVALIGGSGSGKSTVARLVAGLYEPWQGDFWFDSTPREEIAPSVIQQSVALVDQEISLFEGSIRDNLTLWDHTIPDSRVVQAAKDAQIHDDIVSRPGGYDAQVEEGGRNFSGGQRQRLEIARALVRDPTILLLDEATSALDPKTEELIDQNLRRRGCTCLIVAHRLSTIRDCDEILVLKNGVVEERGTHQQLKEAGGHYAQLVGSA